MNELQVEGTQNKEIQTISSKEVAKMMGKQHWELLRMLEGCESPKIVGIIPTLEQTVELQVANYFIESTYNDRGRKLRCYECTKMGCDLLANKMTGEKGILFSAKYVKRFNEMEKIINSDEQLKAKLLLEIYNGGQEGIIATKELVELEKKPLMKTIETQKPKVDYHDKVLNVDKLVTTTDIAKDLGMTARQLHNKLHDMKIIFKTGNHWTFYAKYQTRIPLYADYQIGEHGQILKWTERGRKWIIKLLNEQNEKDKKDEKKIES